jgi:hypothetical protein
MSGLMDDFTFLKYMVCAKNRWNPLDEEVQRLPVHYWFMAYKYIEADEHAKWEYMMKPHAEMIASFANPEAFQNYLKIKEAEQSGKKDVVINANGKTLGYGHSDVVFDPQTWSRR